MLAFGDDAFKSGLISLRAYFDISDLFHLIIRHFALASPRSKPLPLRFYYQLFATVSAITYITAATEHNSFIFCISNIFYRCYATRA